MDFPKLQSGQYAVLKAKVHPALFLGLGPQVDLGKAKWRVFNSLAAARDYASTAVAVRPSVECGIYDAAECQVHTVRV